jgi:hypothetical protein
LGIVERFNRTLKLYINKFIELEKSEKPRRNWWDHLSSYQNGVVEREDTFENYDEIRGHEDYDVAKREKPPTSYEEWEQKNQARFHGKRKREDENEEDESPYEQAGLDASSHEKPEECGV